MSLGDLKQRVLNRVIAIGRPNVGKSTFINKFIGEKIAITSPIAQTTSRLKVILTNKSLKLFCRYPGIHKPHHLLGERLVQSAGDYWEVDAVLVGFEANHSPVGWCIYFEFD